MRIDPSAREGVYLSAHAFFLGRMAVPRLLFPARRNLFELSADEIEAAYKNLLCDPINDVLDRTMRALDRIHAPYKRIAPEDRSRAIEMVEEMLRDVAGEGPIHYEMARFTPDSAEDLWERLKGGEETWLHWFQEANDILKCRFEMRQHLLAQYDEILHKHEARFQAPVYQSVYRQKVDAIWQDRWQSHAHYCRSGPDVRSIHTLPLLDSL